MPMNADARAALQTLHLVERYTQGLSRTQSSQEEQESMNRSDVAYLGAWYQRWRAMQQDRAIKALKELGMETQPQLQTASTKEQASRS